MSALFWRPLCSKEYGKLFNIKGNNYNILQTLNDHTGPVYKIIELKNKYLVSCSPDKSIIFYLKDNNKYKKDYHLSTNGPCYCINEIKENEICYSEVINYGSNNNNICFYNINERKIKSSISNISKSNISPLIMIITNYKKKFHDPKTGLNVIF